jgi:hypothetical protein
MSKKPNPGWFKKGFDPRRHVLSKAEKRKGYWVATQFAKMPSRLRAFHERTVGTDHGRQEAQVSPGM